MTYQELRQRVAANLQNQDALVKLMTPQNVETVARCAPGLAGAGEVYQPGDLEGTWIAGRTVSRNMYDPKDGPLVNTVDEVLAEFTPANAYAARVYREYELLFSEAGADKNVYFTQAAQEATVKRKPEC